MTTTAKHVLHVAEKEVGYHERGGSDGKSGNITKYWAELDPGLQGQPWCACFVRWTDKHADGPILPISNPYYCPSIVTYAKQHGLWKTELPRKGDYVLFDFTGQGVAEHIGRVRKGRWHSRVKKTVEGNTSPSTVGSQTNGGGVYNKDRDESVILGYLDYSKLLKHVKKHHKAPRNRVKHNPNHAPTKALRIGDHEPKKTNGPVHWVQWAVGVPVDGQFGPQTQHAVREFQRFHGLPVTGVVNAKTRAALSHVTH